MGCYDFFVGQCPTCKKEFHCQTKLTRCDFSDLMIGSKVPLKDNRILLKERCESCDHLIIVIIENGRIIGFDNGKSTSVEGPFGTFLDANESYDDRYWKEVGIKL